MIHPLQIQWSDDALQDMRRLGRRTRERIVETVERFAQTGHGDVRPIRGEYNLFRQRVGNWRVFFELSADATAMIILHVRSRQSAYRP